MKNYFFYFLNTFFVAFLVFRVYETNDDKSILLILIYYPFLIVLNLFVALILRLFKNNLYKTFVKSCLLLFILLIPVIMICNFLGLV